MISARGIRTFAQGYMAVLLAFYFLELGYNVVELGLFISVGIAGVAFFAFFVGLISGRVGRRRLLVFFSLVSGAAGLALILSEEYLVLLIVSFVGSLAAGGGGGGGGGAGVAQAASAATRGTMTPVLIELRPVIPTFPKILNDSPLSGPALAEAEAPRQPTFVMNSR